MEQEDKKRPPPPTSGRWKPGQSGNPKGRPPVKRYRESLERVLAALSPGDDGAGAIDRLNAAMYSRAMGGDVGAYKELRELLDGKIPQPATLGITTDLPTVRQIGWLDVLSPPEEHVPSPPMLEGSTSTDAAPKDDDRTEEPKDTDPS